MINRRDFIKRAGIAGVAAALNPHNLIYSQSENNLLNKTKGVNDDSMIWANLIHLSFNMWQDFTPEEYKTESYPPDYPFEKIVDWAGHFQPKLTCEKEAWDKILTRMADSGMNMAVIDLGDGVQYESHPEISVKNAWTPKQLKEVLKQARSIGIEPIPKLNFSAAHKAWLGPYQRQISSQAYYDVCKNLIEEVIDIFDKPRFFHLGMDEETCSHQSGFKYSVVRNNDLWWNDFYYLVDQVERNNVRSWIWSDKAWRDKDEFFRKMPKTVLQSNWNYEEQGPTFTEDGKPNDAIGQAFIDLEEHGFDQIPSCSLWLNKKWVNYDNFDRIVKHTKRIIEPQRLKGFMQTTWIPTLDRCLETHYKAIDLVKEVRKKYY